MTFGLCTRVPQVQVEAEAQPIPGRPSSLLPFSKGALFCLTPGLCLTPLRWGMAREALPTPLLPLSHYAEVPTPFLPAIPLTAYGPMAAAAAAAAVVRGTGSHPWTMAPPPGSTPSRTGGFLGTTSPGPMAELYGAANQDSGVSSYISAASPAPSTGFGHSLGGPLIATAFTNGYH
uniref:Uncharacterized protein n=1 Tax=Capra hircus TaxID=9925 RepID=A0A8C2RFM5_CAPHI